MKAGNYQPVWRNTCTFWGYLLPLQGTPLKVNDTQNAAPKGGVLRSKDSKGPQIARDVRQSLIAKFPSSIRADIQTLENFLGDLPLLTPALT